MEKKSSLFVVLGYLYLIIPNLIFIIGWCNTPTAIVCSLVLIYGLYFVSKNAPELWVPSSRKERILLLVAFFIAFLWAYLAGIGGFSFQNFDHSYRNEIFELLADREWPVVIDHYYSIMIYYIGFWMPAALITKINGEFILGYFVQLLWATLGVFLVFYYMLAVFKKKVLWPIFLFIFFSGMDIIGLYFFNKELYARFFFSSLIDIWAIPHIFSSMTYLLFWVFNQALPAWVFTFLLLHQKNNKNIIFLMVILLLFSTLPAFGATPFALYFCLKNGEEDFSKIFTFSHIKKAICSSLSLCNISALLILFPVIYLYFSYNYTFGTFGMASELHDTIIKEGQFDLDYNRIFKYIRFFILEAGILIFCLFFYHKKNPLLYIIFLTLISGAFLKIGFGMDFEMRTSIPALVFLFYLTVKTLQECDLNRHKIIVSIMLIFLAIGTVTPIQEFGRIYKQRKFGTDVKAMKIDLTNVTPNPNFFGKIYKNKFLEYFGKETEQLRITKEKINKLIEQEKKKKRKITKS